MVQAGVGLDLQHIREGLCDIQQGAAPDHPQGRLVGIPAQHAIRCSTCLIANCVW